MTVKSGKYKEKETKEGSKLLKSKKKEKGKSAGDKLKSKTAKEINKVINQNNRKIKTNY